nr:hypothetical protein [Cellulomonas sp. H30R-01]
MGQQAREREHEHADRGAEDGLDDAVDDEPVDRRRTAAEPRQDQRHGGDGHDGDAVVARDEELGDHLEGRDPDDEDPRRRVAGEDRGRDEDAQQGAGDALRGPSDARHRRRTHQWHGRGDRGPVGVAEARGEGERAGGERRGGVHRDVDDDRAARERRAEGRRCGGGYARAE